MEESKQNKIILLRQMVENAERNIAAARQILSQLDNSSKKESKNSEASQIVEGSFDGEKMIGLDGKRYPVPPNYASKSKLVEGDLLKLTITENGSFVYKQISPAERRKVIGIVMVDDKGKHCVSSEGRKYKVLLASLTYFKAKEGDEVTLIVPAEKISKWGAIEAVIDDMQNGESGLNAGDDDTTTAAAGKSVVAKKKKEAAEKDLLEERKDEIIEDEWTANIEDIKKEVSTEDHIRDSEIEDDFSKE